MADDPSNEDILFGPFPDTLRQPLYAWIGLCIKDWADVESWLFKLCCLALGTDKVKVAIVFYRTPTIDSRLKLVDELLRTILPARSREDGGHDHPDVITWKAIVRDIQELLPIRNLLAHAPLQQAPFLKIKVGDEYIAAVSWAEVATGRDEQLRAGSRHSIRDKDLPDHFLQLVNIVTRLRTFYNHVLQMQPAAQAQSIIPQTRG